MHRNFDLTNTHSVNIPLVSHLDLLWLWQLMIICQPLIIGGHGQTCTRGQQSTSLPPLPFTPAASKPWTNECVHYHCYSLLLQSLHEMSQQTSSQIHLHLSPWGCTSSFCIRPCSDPSSCSMHIYPTLAFHQLLSPIPPFLYPVPFLSPSQDRQWMWSGKLTGIFETFSLSGCN